jgi:hypothetical protein
MQRKRCIVCTCCGNDAKDIDFAENFPNDSEDKVKEFADNVITIGALNFEYGESCGSFFKHRKLNVDVLRRSKIYATTPNNEYQYLQGTSMAAPIPLELLL